MNKNIIPIQFDNKLNPNSAFDLILLEEMYQRVDLNHDIEMLHKVEFFIIILITEGRSRHHIDFEDFSVEKGSLLTIRKDQIHRFVKAPKTKGYLLLFRDDFMLSYLEKLEAQKSLQIFNELLVNPKIQLNPEQFELIHSIVIRIQHEYASEMDDYALGIIRSELHILITKLFRIKSTKGYHKIEKKYLAEFINFQKLVEENVNSEHKVSDYAKRMFISTKTLNTITKRIINKTAKGFIDEIRVKQIKRLLINTHLNINEIAYKTGFDEPTNFFKYFKKQVGTTPEQFRLKI